MSREQRAMILAGVAVLATIFGGFVMTWFDLSAPGMTERVDLHGATLCLDSACRRMGLSHTGFFGDNALMTLWGSVLLAIFVVGQVALKVLRGYANAAWMKKGYYWGVTMVGTVLTTAYLFPPDAPAKFATADVSRTWAPLVLAIGQIAGLVACYYSTDSTNDDDVGEYKPVVIAKPSGIGPK